MRTKTWIVMAVVAVVSVAAWAMGPGAGPAPCAVRGAVAEGVIVAVPAAGVLELDNGMVVEIVPAGDSDGDRLPYHVGQRIRAVGTPMTAGTGTWLVTASLPSVVPGVEAAGGPPVRAAGRDGDGSVTVSGTVGWVGPSSFTLRTGMRMYTVTVTETTVFEGVDGLGGLTAGDEVRVVGSSMGMNSVEAATVTLLPTGGGDDDGGGDGDGGGGGGGSGGDGDGGGGGSDDSGVHMFNGSVMWVGSDGFGLRVSLTAAYTVMVTAGTSFDGCTGLADLSMGDSVEVEGTMTGAATIEASIVTRRSHGEETELEGVVTAILPDAFMLRAGTMGMVEVLVDGNTVWDGLGGLADLEVDDRVAVAGTLEGTTMQAAHVQFLSPGGGGGDGGGNGGGGTGGSHSRGETFESAGEVTAIVGPGPEAFWLDDGRRYRVMDDTEFGPEIGSAAGLHPGLFVRVEAAYRHGTGLAAERVVALGDRTAGQEYEDFSGTVEAVSASELVLAGGAQLTLTGATRFEGDADTAAEILAGWRVEGRAVEAEDGSVQALLVRSENPEPPVLEGQEYVPHEALVIPESGANLGTIAARHGAVLVGTIGSLGGLFRWDGALTDELLASVEADPEVAAVEPNYLFRDPESGRKRYPIVDRSPTSSEFDEQPALAVADVPRDGDGSVASGIVVAVVDTGVDPLHPALRRAILPGGLDLVDGDTEPWESRDGLDEDGDGDVDEAAGHGTFVASLVALVAPGVRILPYRVLDDDGGGTAYELAVALADAIERRVDVINLSLTYHERSRAVDELLERAAAAGIVVVAAAGNDGAATLPFPAEDGHVIAVGALDAAGTALAEFSDRQAAGILAAPGTDVYGALDRGTFGTSTGTSMAAPFVTAAAALALQSAPRLDPDVLATVLRGTGVPLGEGSATDLRLDVAAALAVVAP